MAREVFGKSLPPEELTAVKVVLTRVAPGGEFALPKDPYPQVFWFLDGAGRGRRGERQSAIRPGHC